VNFCLWRVFHPRNHSQKGFLAFPEFSPIAVDGDDDALGAAAGVNFIK